MSISGLPGLKWRGRKKGWARSGRDKECSEELDEEPEGEGEGSRITQVSGSGADVGCRTISSISASSPSVLCG